MSALKLLRLALTACLLLGSIAHAQLFRAYLSPTGSDANPCTLPAPCRLLPAALNAVANGGEIWLQGSANYNTSTVIINKSVSILAVPGVVGSIVTQNGGSAVSITTNGIEVSLRNVVIGPVAGASPGAHGVEMTGDSKLTIEHSLIANVPQDGVIVVGTGLLKISNTTLRNNGGYAIELLNGASADIATSHMQHNTFGGVRAAGSVGKTSATISDSTITGDEWYLAASVGVRTNATTGGTARISITRSTISHIGTALDCRGLGHNILFFSSNLIAYVDYGWSNSENCAVIYSDGRNQHNDMYRVNGTISTLGLI